MDVAVAGSFQCRVLGLALGRSHLGVSENKGVPFFGVLMVRILLFRVLY